MFFFFFKLLLYADALFFFKHRLRLLLNPPIIEISFVFGQSIIPGILQGDKSDSVLYGSVDNGKKIYWNEAFHAKVRCLL